MNIYQIKSLDLVFPEKIKERFLGIADKKRLLENFFSLSVLQRANYLLPLNFSFYNAVKENSFPIEDILVHTGQHYDFNMSDIFFSELRIPYPKYHLGVGSDSHGYQTAKMIERIVGGFGDGGMITTNDEKIAELIRMLLKHGGKDKYNVDHIGYNARLDTIQAAVLLAKMDYVDEFTEGRRKTASIYNEGLKALNWLKTPSEHPKAYHVYHQYTSRLVEKDINQLQRYLKENVIDSMVYYPVPLHKMKVFINNGMEIFENLENRERASESVLSLPIEPLMGRSYYMK